MKTTIADIIPDPNMQVRAGTLNMAAVDAYEDAYRDPTAVMPPVAVFKVRSKIYLVDGFHRLAGALKAGKLDIQAQQVGEGTYEDAVAKALTYNHSHGLHRTIADKRKAVEIALTLPHFKDKSSRVVAEHCGVSRTLVESVMSRSASSEPEPSSQPSLSSPPEINNLDDIGFKATETADNDFNDLGLAGSSAEEPAFSDEVAEFMRPERVQRSDGKWVKKKEPKHEKGDKYLDDAEGILRKAQYTLSAWAKELSGRDSYRAGVLFEASKLTRSAVAGLNANRPVGCPECVAKGCLKCQGKGWLPKRVAEQMK